MLSSQADLYLGCNRKSSCRQEFSRADVRRELTRPLNGYDACCCSQRPSAPLSAAVLRFGLQGSVDHLGNLVVLVGARPAESELIVQAFLAQLSVALAPLADGHASHPIRLTIAVLLSTAP